MSFWTIWGFLGAFLGDLSTPKRVNEEFSGIGTCKFEFSTIKNHYKDIHNDILDKSLKKPQNGVFLALKGPRGREPEFCRGGRYYLYVHNNYLRVLEKFQKNLMDG